MIRIIITIIFIISFIASSSHASTEYWNNLLSIGEQCSGLPKELILSVIHVESKGNPYAVNINGVGGFQPRDIESAVKILYHYNRANSDIGLMQINYLSWGKVFNVSPVDLFRPEVNVCIGSKILRYYIDMHNGSWRGVGRYNAVSSDKATRYALSVYRVYRMYSKLLNNKEGQ